MRKIYFLFVISFLFTNLHAQSLNTWIGGTGEWHNESNWSSGSIPSAGEQVVIQPSGAVCTIDDRSAASGGIVVESGAELVIEGSSGTLTISSNASHDGIQVDNDGKLILGLNTSLTISQTGGSGVEGQGILNFGEVTNDGDIFIGGDIDETGIWNRAGGTFTNNGTIEFGDIDFRGIDNLGGTFINNGIIEEIGSLGNNFIATANNSNFTNSECALLQSYKEAINASDMVNNGLILDLSGRNLDMDINNGIIIKINGGSLNINVDDGYTGFDNDYCVWTGCVNGVGTNPNNWFKSGGIPDANDLIIIPEFPQGGAVFPVFDGVDRNIDATGELEIEQNAEVDINNAPGIGLEVFGTVICEGKLSFDGSGNNAIRNQSSGDITFGEFSTLEITNTTNAAFVNAGNCTIDGDFTVESVSKNGLFNSGTIFADANANVLFLNCGLSGLVNQGSFETQVGSDISIIETDDVGILNTGDLTNKGSILLEDISFNEAILNDGGVFENVGDLTESACS